MKQLGQETMTGPETQDLRLPTDKEEWKRLLEEMDPEDFGKYKM